MNDRQQKESKFVKSSRVSRKLLPLRTISTNTMNFGKQSTVSSPMSSLAMNLSELSTGRGTPKRRLSLSSVDTPTGSNKVTPERMSSTESGCFMDSPTPIDSPTLEMSLNQFGSLLKANPEIPLEAYSKRKTIAFRRINSLPLPTMRLDSPTDFLDKENSCSPNRDSCLESDQLNFYLEDTCSQDSGLGFDREKDEHLFAAPVGVPPRKTKIINEDTCSPQKYSPVKSPSKKRSFSETFQLQSSDEDRPEPFGSPVQLKSSLLASTDDDVDDGFLDVFDQEVAEITDPVPDSMASLFRAPVINKGSTAQDDDTPVSRRTLSRKPLLRHSQSFDVRSRPFSHKRIEPPRDELTPIQNKRRRPESLVDTSDFTAQPVARSKFHRCHSETEAMIKSALSRLNEENDPRELIGDFSKPYVLPTVAGKHQDLKEISPETFSQLLNQEFNHEVSEFHIVDCRYPYEFDGGHIQGALNLYTKDSILQKFINPPITASDPDKRQIIIFHCEFSSERGPNLCRFLRNRDREVNKESYPCLRHPELYILSGGYKAFYENHQNQCVPMTYKPMLHKDHKDDLLHFRAKSKSWAGEKGHRSTGLRHLKF